MWSMKVSEQQNIALYWWDPYDHRSRWAEGALDASISWNRLFPVERDPADRSNDTGKNIGNTLKGCSANWRFGLSSWKSLQKGSCWNPEEEVAPAIIEKHHDVEEFWMRALEAAVKMSVRYISLTGFFRIKPWHYWWEQRVEREYNWRDRSVSSRKHWKKKIWYSETKRTGSHKFWILKVKALGRKQNEAEAEVEKIREEGGAEKSEKSTYSWGKSGWPVLCLFGQNTSWRSWQRKSRRLYNLEKVLKNDVIEDRMKAVCSCPCSKKGEEMRLRGSLQGL